MTIGIDLGDRHSHVCVLDATGEIVEESRIATTPKTLRARFDGLAPTRIAHEVGGHSAWVSELLKGLGHDVIVANARKLRMIFQSDSKNDRLDAEQLARVARMDPKLLYPIEHRNRSARADLAVMRSRDALVSTRTRLVNHIHGVLKSFGYRVKKYAAASFHRQVADQIPSELKPALQPLLEMLASIAERALDEDVPRDRTVKASRSSGPAHCATLRAHHRGPQANREEPERWRVPWPAAETAPIGPV
jgi:transposase